MTIFCIFHRELGCHTEILTKERVKDRFPWINTDGVEVACLGTEGEGWYALLTKSYAKLML